MEERQFGIVVYKGETVVIRRFIRFLFLCIVVVVLIIVFAPSLLRGAGNAVVTSLNNTAAQGIAQIIPHAEGKGADLQVKLDGLTANTSYYVSLDQGQCGGPALFNVGKITANASGSTTATLSLNDIRNAVQQGLYVDVHEGTDTTGQSVACGPVLSTNNIISQFTGSSSNDTTPTATTVAVTSKATATATSPPIIIPTTNTSSVDTSNTDSLFLHGRLLGGFPDTGVAPANNSSYDNYTYPRKY